MKNYFEEGKRRNRLLSRKRITEDTPVISTRQLIALLRQIDESFAKRLDDVVKAHHKAVMKEDRAKLRNTKKIQKSLSESAKLLFPYDDED